MVEQIILGILQGISEWLPVSSEGLIVLAKTNLFHSEASFETIIGEALFLHFGTFLAALVYFYKDVLGILQTVRTFKTAPEEDRRLLSFLFLSTIISGLLGLLLIKTISQITALTETSGKIITFGIGCLLLGTAYLELNAKRNGGRTILDLRWSDGILLGIVQGFAALPGFSRSGLTVSTLLLRKMSNTTAIKLSFLMSLPIVLAGNMTLNMKMFFYSPEKLIGILFAFLFGLATIHLLLKVAEKINFGYFVLMFGLLTIVSVFI